MYGKAHVPKSWGLSSAPFSPGLNEMLSWCKCCGLHRVGRFQGEG